MEREANKRKRKKREGNLLYLNAPAKFFWGLCLRPQLGDAILLLLLKRLTQVQGVNDADALSRNGPISGTPRFME